jgi:hypothetical protein
MTHSRSFASLFSRFSWFSWLGALLLTFCSSTSRADIPPSCDAESSLITCAATDVGKPCQGGGQCFEIACQNGASGMKVYKCAACPTIVAAPADTCTFAKLGMTCSGDGGTGTCGVVPAYCNAGKLACQMPAQNVPTGPPTGGAGTGGGVTDGGAGTGGGSTDGGGGTTGAAGTGSGGAAGNKSSGGCDIAPNPPKPTAIGLGLLAIGVVAFGVDRVRRRRRSR